MVRPTSDNPADAIDDSDGDGVTNVDEYRAGSNPQADDDSDHDGTNNSADAHPLDIRRTSDIPQLNYVSIDISTPAVGEVDISDVAINEQGQVGFCWHDDYGGTYSAVWNAGLVTTATLPQGASRSEIEYSPALQEDVLKIEGFAYTAGDVNASGALAGLLYTDCWLYYRPGPDDMGPFDPPPDPMYPDFVVWKGQFRGDQEGAFKWTPGGNPPSVTWHLFYPELAFTTPRGITNSDILWGTEEDSTGGFIGGDGLLGGDWFPSAAHPESFPLTVMSTNGSALGYTSVYHEQGTEISAACWSNGFFYPFGAPDLDSALYGINDAQEVLGLSSRLPPTEYFSDAPSDGAHLFWFSGNSVKDFYFALPEDFRRQLRFTPSDPGPFFNAAGDMVFYAQVAAGTPEEPTWADATLLWQRSTNTLKRVSLPAGMEMRSANYDRFNWYLIMVGLKYESVLGGGQPTRRAEVNVPIEFTTSDITKGFDYPLAGDPPDPVSVWDWHGGVKDDDAPEWWTSIGQGPIFGADLHVNTHVTADIGEDVIANLLTIRVKPQDEPIINLSETELLGKETPLTITGKTLPEATAVHGHVEIVTKASPIQVKRTLDVMSLVKWVIPVRICYVYDGNRGPDEAGQNPTRVLDAFRNTQEIIDNLNRAFRQACVQFYADSSSGPVRVDYDGWYDAFGNLHNWDSSLWLGTGETSADLDSPELSRFRDPRFDLKMPTIFVVADLIWNLDSRVGTSVTNHGLHTPWIFVEQQCFLPANIQGYYNCCAHEIGHVLTLSTRNYGGTSPFKAKHDAGVQPDRYNAKTLMYPGSNWGALDIWIRHEDWYPANQQAEAISIALDP